MYVNQGEKKKKVKETSAKYEGIVRWIREQIEAEELQPGERIESEYQLCDCQTCDRCSGKRRYDRETPWKWDLYKGKWHHRGQTKKNDADRSDDNFCSGIYFFWYYSGNREQDVTRRIWNPDFHHQQFCRQRTFYIEKHSG